MEMGKKKRIRIWVRVCFLNHYYFIYLQCMSACCVLRPDWLTECGPSPFLDHFPLFCTERIQLSTFQWLWSATKRECLIWSFYSLKTCIIIVKNTANFASCRSFFVSNHRHKWRKFVSKLHGNPKLLPFISANVDKPRCTLAANTKHKYTDTSGSQYFKAYK